MSDDETFAKLERCAVNNERCPSDLPHGTLKQGAVGRLAKAGRVRSEVFRGNWRVVTLLTGPNAGKTTKEAPHPHGKPYIIMDANGTFMGGRMQEGSAPKRIGPSPPRNLSKGY